MPVGQSAKCIDEAVWQRQRPRRTHTKATSARGQRDCSHEGHFCAGFGAAAPVSPTPTPARKLGTCSFLRKNEHVPNLRAGVGVGETGAAAPNPAQKWPSCEQSRWPRAEVAFV